MKKTLETGERETICSFDIDAMTNCMPAFSGWVLTTDLVTVAGM